MGVPFLRRPSLTLAFILVLHHKVGTLKKRSTHLVFWVFCERLLAFSLFAGSNPAEHLSLDFITKPPSFGGGRVDLGVSAILLKPCWGGAWESQNTVLLFWASDSAH